MGNMVRKAGSAGEAGEIITVGGKRYICAYTALTDVAAGAPLLIDNVCSAYTPCVTRPASTAVTLCVKVVVSEHAISAAGWYWFVYAGKVKACVLAHASAVAGCTLKLTNGGTNFATDATVGAAWTTNGLATLSVAPTSSAGATALAEVFIPDWRIGNNGI